MKGWHQKPHQREPGTPKGAWHQGQNLVALGAGYHPAPSSNIGMTPPPACSIFFSCYHTCPENYGFLVSSRPELKP